MEIAFAKRVGAWRERTQCTEGRDKGRCRQEVHFQTPIPTFERAQLQARPLVCSLQEQPPPPAPHMLLLSQGADKGRKAQAKRSPVSQEPKLGANPAAFLHTTTSGTQGKFLQKRGFQQPSKLAWATHYGDRVLRQSCSH